MTESEYEQLLESNERTLWEITERHGKLCRYVSERVYPKAAMTLTPDMRSQMAEELREMGCEVEA